MSLSMGVVEQYGVVAVASAVDAAPIRQPADLQDPQAARAPVDESSDCLNDGDGASGSGKEDDDEEVWVQLLPNRQTGASPIDTSDQNGTLDEREHHGPILPSEADGTRRSQVTATSIEHSSNRPSSDFEQGGPQQQPGSEGDQIRRSTRTRVGEHPNFFRLPRPATPHLEGQQNSIYSVRPTPECYHRPWD
ncbi:hypothetical protein NHX12_015382 [Muraenolepis orangiensis]|uniref:Uncharacterized protein n=1 Tax=Muraenolepis orangiensis TaxID=630683 RepID=A0A9Q0I3H0_9TELE|nr:hypothetical protein NHX12_015382 [Muraenolepis orangiensis]